MLVVYAVGPVPTLQAMLVHLSEVGSDWFVFGSVLGVPISKLKSIEAYHLKEGVKRCILEMMQYWLDTTPAACWQQVTAALEQVDLITLASRIKQKYLWDHSVNATAPPSSTPPTPPPPPPPPGSTDSGAELTMPKLKLLQMEG